MKIEITFRDEVDATTLEQSYDDFIDYLRVCVDNDDVTSFNFSEMEDDNV